MEAAVRVAERRIDRHVFQRALGQLAAPFGEADPLPSTRPLPASCSLISPMPASRSSHSRSFAFGQTVGRMQERVPVRRKKLAACGGSSYESCG